MKRGIKGSGGRATRPAVHAGRGRKLGVVDYTLAKRALLRDVQRGLLGLTDICDAHPELMRAAHHVGEPSRHDCPVCGKEKLVLLAYVYGDDLKQDNGRVWDLETALKLAAAHRGSACYVVEVCRGCQWNHLSEAFTARSVG
jgi:hypothetical protein